MWKKWSKMTFDNPDYDCLVCFYYVKKSPLIIVEYLKVAVHQAY